MKTRIIFSTLLSFVFCLLSSQVPQGFNYQAIARGSDGKELADQSIQVMLTIKPDSNGTGVIWEELHNPVITNKFGLFTVVLGKGTRQGTSGVATFSAINWTAPQYFIKTKVYYQSAWKEMGTARLWSVPYAMATGNISGTVNKLKVTGTEALLDSALFEVKNKDGQTVFAVYNEGVRIYVDDGDPGKGTKGGFAIGSFNKTKGVNDYFIVTGDSIRAYIDTGLVKARKGGFAIGSFSKTKVGREEYLRITRDSTRFYINDTGTKARKGGFAIGGFDKSKGIFQDFMLVSKDSIRMYIKEPAKATKGGFAIGGFSTAKAPFPQYLSVLPARTNIQVSDTIKGFSITNIQGGGSSDFMRIDKINSFIGHETGLLTAPSSTGEQGKYNVFLGYQSGNKNTLGYKNVFMGYHAGMLNVTAEHNIFIGTESGVSNVSGRYNTFLGSESGALNTASENTFLGYSAGVLNTTGQFNTFIGTNSGAFHNTGDYNTFIGWGSGNNNSGAKNVFLGASAGSSNTGTGNVYLGYNANMAGSNRLLITNSSNTPNIPLIYGEFNNKQISINKSTVTTGYTFWVEGAAGGLYNWNTTSDERLKTNINTISDALGKVLELRGVNYEWKDTLSMEKGNRIGFIAQEVMKVVPEVVSVSDGILMLQYGPVSALLVESVKTQQKMIIDQRETIKDLLETTKQLRLDYDHLVNEINILKSQSNNEN